MFHFDEFRTEGRVQIDIGGFPEGEVPWHESRRCFYTPRRAALQLWAESEAQVAVTQEHFSRETERELEIEFRERRPKVSVP